MQNNCQICAKASLMKLFTFPNPISICHMAILTTTIAIHLTSCGGDAPTASTPPTTNNSTTQHNTTTTPETPLYVPDGRTGTRIFLDGLYATSENNPIQHILDGNKNTSWTSEPQTATNEGFMLYFPQPTYIKHLQFDGATPNNIAYLPFVNGKALNAYRNSEKVPLETKVSSLYIRFADEDIMTYTFRNQLTIGKPKPNVQLQIAELILTDDKDQPYVIVPPQAVTGTITASSTLAPEAAYLAANLTDSRREFVWAEGSPSNGIGESIIFQFDRDVTLSALKIWNGYQRSDEHFKANGRVKSFLFGPRGGTLLPYNLNDDSKPTYQQLNSPIKSKTWELKIEDIYPGKKYTDLVISEIRFFDGEIPIVLKTQSKQQINQALQAKIKNTLLDTLLNRTISNQTDSNTKTEKSSILLRKDGTFVLYAETYASKAANEQATKGQTTTETIVADGNWNSPN
jgi:hypothetical protein